MADLNDAEIAELRVNLHGAAVLRMEPRLSGAKIKRLLDEVERWRKMVRSIAAPLGDKGGTVTITHVGPPPVVKPIKP